MLDFQLITQLIKNYRKVADDALVSSYSMSDYYLTRELLDIAASLSNGIVNESRQGVSQCLSQHLHSATHRTVNQDRCARTIWQMSSLLEEQLKNVESMSFTTDIGNVSFENLTTVAAVSITDQIDFFGLLGGKGSWFSSALCNLTHDIK